MSGRVGNLTMKIKTKNKYLVQLIDSYFEYYKKYIQPAKMSLRKHYRYCLWNIFKIWNIEKICSSIVIGDMIRNSFICPHCLEIINFSDIAFKCPECNVYYPKKIHPANKKRGLLDKCKKCKTEIEAFPCYHCKNIINLNEGYDYVGLKEKKDSRVM